jgi:hypothetical protein
MKINKNISMLISNLGLFHSKNSCFPDRVSDFILSIASRMSVRKSREFPDLPSYRVTAPHIL